jgi:hypothetical protein
VAAASETMSAPQATSQGLRSLSRNPSSRPGPRSRDQALQIPTIQGNIRVVSCLTEAGLCGVGAPSSVRRSLVSRGFPFGRRISLGGIPERRGHGKRGHAGPQEEYWCNIRSGFGYNMDNCECEKIYSPLLVDVDRNGYRLSPADVACVST